MAKISESHTSVVRRSDLADDFKNADDCSPDVHNKLLKITKTSEVRSPNDCGPQATSLTIVSELQLQPYSPLFVCDKVISATVWSPNFGLKLSSNLGQLY